MTPNVPAGATAVVLAFVLPVAIEAMRSNWTAEMNLPAVSAILDTGDISRRVAELGLWEVTRPQRRGDVYVVDVKADGARRTLVIDAVDGHVVGRAAPERAAGIGALAAAAE